MGKAGIAGIVIVLGYAAFEVYGLHASRHVMEPGHIYRQFTGASHAMARCGEPEPGQRARFERNLASVGRRARRDLEQAHPDKAPAAIDALLAEQRRSREAEIDALVAAQGCAGKDVLMLVMLYESRAKLKLQ